MGILFNTYMAKNKLSESVNNSKVPIDVVIEKQDEVAKCMSIDGNLGNFSDNYHTFNELYHHRAILFALVCDSYKEMAWKSKLHDDGTMYDDMFIVGISTPNGQATYHYDIDPYWDLFSDIRELPMAPKYDGHTPTEATERLLLLINKKCYMKG